MTDAVAERQECPGLARLDDHFVEELVEQRHNLLGLVPGCLVHPNCNRTTSEDAPRVARDLPQDVLKKIGADALLALARHRVKRFSRCAAPQVSRG